MSDVKEKDGIPSAADSPETAVDTEPVADTAEAPEAEAAAPPEAEPAETQEAEAEAPEAETPTEDAPATDAPEAQAPAEETPAAVPAAVPLPAPDAAEASATPSDTPPPTGGKPVKKTKKYSFGGTFWPGIFILVILLLISFVVLGFRLSDYANRDNREVLLKSNMDAELDIFSVTYKNSDGEIVIEGAEGEKVIAPGAWVDYSVYLRNKDTIAIDYTFISQVEVINNSEHPELELPLVYRILDDNLDYLVGDPKTWVDRTALDGLSSNGTLLPNESAEYTFQWKWPFEGDDEFDTFLGNSEEDIGLKITFVLRSEANTSIGLGDDFWRSGPGRALLIIIFALLLLIAIILLIIAYFKRKHIETVVEPVVEPEVVVEPEPVIEPVVEPVFTASLSLPGKKTHVNLDVLVDHFDDGESITLFVLKSRGIVPASTKQIKILARNAADLSKAFHIEAQGVSASAKQYIETAGGSITIVPVDESIHVNEDIKVEEAIRESESIQLEEPVHVSESVPVEEPVQAEEPMQIEEPEPVDEVEINRIEKIR